MSVYNLSTRMSSAENSVDDLQTALNAKANQLTTYTKQETNALLGAKAPTANPTFTGTATFSGTVDGITKTMVGLGNVDNTSDNDKPISALTQTALNAKADSSTTYTKGEVDTELGKKQPTIISTTSLSL